MSVVDLSRLQFAITAMYHFLFVPLTLGLVVIIAMMETVYVVTGRTIWKQMTKFWGLLFGINFAMGVATGITLEFQFGTNWSYYAHFVGDIFGVPLAIEGMMAFFLEATFVGIFFFGWDRLSKVGHLLVTWLLALGTSLSAFWILIANGWMQNPVGSFFNPDTMRMELSSLYDIIMNPVAQCKFVHTLSAGYITGAIFVACVSFYYLLRGRHTNFALRSLRVALPFGFMAAISAIILGDESGYTDGHTQKMKLAAMEAAWETETPPASLTLIGWPDKGQGTTHYAVKVPYLLGILATRSLSKPVYGIHDLVQRAREHILEGQLAYKALQDYRADRSDAQALEELTKHSRYIGYGFLLKKYTPDILKATPAQIDSAAKDTVPNVPVIFLCFRIMVGCGFFFLLYFALGSVFVMRGTMERRRWFMHLWPWTFPLPWIASWSGWMISEYGRQPWAIYRILPTSEGVSSVPASFVGTTLMGFIFFYTFLAVVDFYLMIKYIRLGPVRAFHMSDPTSQKQQNALAHAKGGEGGEGDV
jgi:cytochrome d ubiquinol oxidase subunit I